MNTRPTRGIGIATITAVLSATLAVVGLGGSTAHASSSAEVQAMAPDTYESDVHYWINRERATRGLRKLRFHSCTDTFAENWSQHLLETDSFYHQELQPIINQCDARYASEALGLRMSDPRTMVTAWMQSTGHRKLLLSKKPRRLGVGAVLNADGAWVVTATFTRL